MNISHKKLLAALALGTLSLLSVHAEGVTVLEGFENGLTVNAAGVTNIAPFSLYGDARGTPCTVSIYTATDPSDPRVTEGTHSAKIVFPADGFGNDIGFALSDAAATILENAVSSNQVARYILRYDVIFEHIELLAYFNQHFFIGNDWEYVRSGGAALKTVNGVQYGVSSFSVPIELPGIGLPHNAPDAYNSADFAAAGQLGLTAFMADQFNGVSEPLNNYTIYLDNFRLVDTYANSATVPVTYPLQSFEGSDHLGGAANLAPSTTTLIAYSTNGEYNAATDGGAADQFTGGYPQTLDQESDFAVTDGTHALEVVNNAAYYSYDDFSLPFTGTRLAQILSLNLTPAQLAHFTVRWDVTTPMVPVAAGGTDNDYINIDYNAINGAIFPMSTGRRQSDGQLGLQRETYSSTLDQILYWPSAAPGLGFSYSQPGYPSVTWGASPFFFDNFVLINTAPKYTYITAESYNSAAGSFTLTWLSEPSQTYTVQYAPTLVATFTPVAQNVPSGGDYTTKTVTIPGGAAGYLRILAQ
ncbi:MAG TPA: hypothetical protein VHB20_17020 [Verrucomicrobiae bacterium]|jgi:hypothetical protein|nr:hypothetical protein [Verrucomicrobiae bacterium]